MTSMLTPNCRVWLRIATVSGAFSVLAKTNATSRSFHVQRNWKIASDAMAGQPDRQHDRAEHAELARAVDPRRLQQLAGDAGEEVAQQEDGERQAERDVEQHHADDVAEDAESP